MDVRVVLVAAEEDSRRRYVQELDAHGVHYDVVESLAQLHQALTRAPYNGILLDVPTLIRAGSAEKALTHELLEIYPALRLSWDPAEQRIRAMYYGQTGETGHTLADFVATQAGQFRARTYRRMPRADVALCVTLTRLNGDQTERTVVVNMSEAGCFVITTNEWCEDAPLELAFPDLEAAGPFSARCRRVVPWGAGCHMPGIGVSFEGLTLEQEQALRGLLKTRDEEAQS